MNLKIGDTFEKGINWLTDNFEGFFDGINQGVGTLIDSLETTFTGANPWVLIGILVVLAWYLKGWKNFHYPIMTLIGFAVIVGMGLWEATVQTLALVLVATFIALLIGIPVGIFAGRSEKAETVVRPILDFMQTMPAFVYLIPAVLFFELGKVPGAMATVIFAMPPAVRLTSLGLRHVPKEVMEAAVSFGSTTTQQLVKVQLPSALPSILAGINQTIMLSLSMVVIAAMIGAGGLGKQVLFGITQLKIGLGFEAGLSVVILAIYLDRVTQAMGEKWGNR
ncbi:Glycine betaine transport system permease protein OpuAB [Sedimentisphaera cyanobacteriorum]|uniref:Glycine betaine transport system permease protein OpuAB n=1 Tax=Sedimentisphaera cyanobacteriorum TaxID=1940790 RepID=A0A1Q2HPM2_9BACT|nr:proline/glycine betaine ABC transporter permease [Sedimentisphaera cyanobacteriorum]AQQ09281.1 Glycine betaine transport system permease protein OpuAB [Sedimentisphaera cyanobacteriorum]